MAETQRPVIEVRDFTKRYGETTAVDGISFEVHQGEVFAIVGPNGAGKTTTLESLQGIRQADRGELRVFGHDPHRERSAVIGRLGVQFQESRLWARTRVSEALALFASFYEQPVDWRGLLEPLGLTDKRNAAFAGLSGGQKQRLFVGLALVGDPELLFLDEITTGLDPHARRAMWELIRRLQSQGKTVILSTHFLEEAETLADRVAILDRGRIVALDTPAALIRDAKLVGVPQNLENVFLKLTGHALLAE